MFKSSVLALLAVTSLAAPALATPYTPQKVTYGAAAKPVTLPAGAEHTRDYGTGRNAIIIPTYHQNQAPQRILVGNREYSRERFDQYKGTNGLVGMRYAETPESSARAHAADVAKRLAASKARSW